MFNFTVFTLGELQYCTGQESCFFKPPREKQIGLNYSVLASSKNGGYSLHCLTGDGKLGLGILEN